MALKKSELYASLWKSCDELRGGMDASQYKDYVLVLLFVKYVSDKARANPQYEIDVPEGGGFADMVKLKGDKEIGDKLNKIVARLAEANELRGVITVADWNDPNKLGKGNEMVDRLSSLVAIFERLDFSGNRAEGDDLLGDAYEYLMRHFATESGKSKGQFYTPAEVSRVMAKVIGLSGARGATQSIYDPTCGSGSLLLKAHDEAKGATGYDLALYGQEMDNATRALARMNLILHGCPTAEVWQDNTLSTPHFKDARGGLKTFDFVVANPPFSTKAWMNGFDPANDTYRRFALGVPPPKNGDYAFLLHVLASLKTTGRGAVILPHGVLFRGGAEAAIRRALVEGGYIEGIIGLPPNLFYGTGIPACIVVLDRAGAGLRRSIFMVDAAAGFVKDGAKNRLREQDVHKIVDTFVRKVEVPRYARRVDFDEIAGAKNDFNLNLPRYVDTAEAEDIHDLGGHLQGGLPERDVDALAEYWQAFPGLRAALFAPLRPGYVQLRVEAGAVRGTIAAHPEFLAFCAEARGVFQAWRVESAPMLCGLAPGDAPKRLIGALSEALLSHFGDARLLDAYDVYQHLMDLWAETMQDDVYLVVAEGWTEAARLRPLAEDRAGKTRPDLVVGRKKYRAELIPPALVIARFLTAEKAEVDRLEAEAATAVQAMEDYAEEHGAEDGALAEARNERDVVTPKAAAARLKVLSAAAADDADERAALDEYLRLAKLAASAEEKADAKRLALTEAVVSRYGTLTEDQVKTLVVEDKWLAAVEKAVEGELARVGQTLGGRLRALGERYSRPLPALVEDVDALAARVAGHLGRMGAG